MGKSAFFKRNGVIKNQPYSISESAKLFADTSLEYLYLHDPKRINFWRSNPKTDSGIKKHIEAIDHFFDSLMHSEACRVCNKPALFVCVPLSFTNFRIDCAIPWCGNQKTCKDQIARIKDDEYELSHATLKAFSLSFRKAIREDQWKLDNSHQLQRIQRLLLSLHAYQEGESSSEAILKVFDKTVKTSSKNRKFAEVQRIAGDNLYKLFNLSQYYAEFIEEKESDVAPTAVSTEGVTRKRTNAQQIALMF